MIIQKLFKRISSKKGKPAIPANQTKLDHSEFASSAAFVSFLKKHGLAIGEGTYFFEPRSNYIDMQRPHMLTIGKYVKITRGVTILCHDYSRSTLLMALGDHVPDSGVTEIGDNVFLGMNSVVLMGAKIGANCIVGAGAVIAGSIPENSVVVGNPARVLCTIDELLQKRKLGERDNAIEYAVRWYQHYGEWPNPADMTNAFSWLYLPRTQETIDAYPGLFKLNGIDLKRYKSAFLSSEPEWSSFEEFIQECKCKVGVLIR